MKKDKDEIVYLITVSDIQNVALQELERQLLPEEIESIRDRISKKIHWFDAIAESIDEIIVNHQM